MRTSFSYRLKKLPRSLLCLTVALGLLGLFLTTPGLAQAAPEAPTSLFGEVVDVRVINLEVVVTEKGERVTGLNPEDFVLKVDGQETPIEYFTEVLGGTAVLPAGAAEAGTLPALRPGEPVETSYLLFIDEYFTLPARRNRVLKELIKQLPVLDPEDRMAVVAFDGTELEMLSTWNQSISSLTRVLEDAMERPARGLQVITERRIYNSAGELGRLRATRFDDFSRDRFINNRLDLEEEQQANLIARQVERAVLAATSALRGFANPPGRKVMLMLSGGWPNNPVQWVVGNLEEAIFESGIPYGNELFSPLLETANRLSYTIYPVDVPTTVYPTADASIGSVENAQVNQEVLYDRIQNERVSLTTIARDTGGKALLDGASFAALERAAADTQTYYWLGFTPRWKGDDSAHKIKLETVHKGQKVRTRTSFSDLSRQSEVTMMVESSLLFGDSPASAPLAAAVGESSKLGRGKVEMPLVVLIPLHELTFLPTGSDEFVAEAELRIAVRDEDGNLAEIPVVPMKIIRKELPREGDLGRFDQLLRMRKRQHDVVVSVYDIASGKILATRLEVDPDPKRPKDDS